MDTIGNLFKSAAHETRLGNIEKAIKDYEKILLLSRSDIRVRHLAHWGMGEIYLNDKQYRKAKYHLSQALRINPDESYSHYLLGCTYTYTNEIDRAIHHLEEAIRLDDSKDIYWNQLGWVIGYNRDIDKGIDYLKRSLSINPKNTKSLLDICMLYAKQLKYDEAMVCIEEAEKNDPDNKEISNIKRELENLRNEFEKQSE